MGPIPCRSRRSYARALGDSVRCMEGFCATICFDIVEVHLLECILRQYGLVQGIPPSCDTEPDLHLISRKNQGTANWMEINGCHIALWDHRLELLAQGAPIDVVGAPSTRDYMPWFLSITRRWMTPRSIIAAVHYAPAAPTMTQYVSLHLHLNDSVADYII